MKKKIFFLLFALIGLTASAASADWVQHVIDGDTVVLENSQRVRLIGIDAPEVDHPRYNRVGEPFGEEAKAYLRERIQGKRVRLEPGPEPFDKYGRRLAYIYLDEECLNDTLVREGYAEAIRYLPYDRKEQYLALEAEARQLGRGMWVEGAMDASQDSQTKRGDVFALIFAGFVFPALFLYLQKKR